MKKLTYNDRDHILIYKPIPGEIIADGYPCQVTKLKGSYYLLNSEGSYWYGKEESRCSTPLQAILKMQYINSQF